MGSVGYEETRSGEQYIMWVIEALQDNHGADFGAADSLIDEYYELVGEYHFNEESAEDCADKIIELELKGSSDVDETVQNVVFNESVTRARFVNEEFRWNEPDQKVPHEAYEPYAPENWTLQEGDFVVFNLMGMAQEWEQGDQDDPDDLAETQSEVAIAHDGEQAKVIGQATASGVGERNFEYYDIEFEDGATLWACSGYHLHDVDGPSEDQMTLRENVNEGWNDHWEDPKEYHTQVYMWLDELLGGDILAGDVDLIDKMAEIKIDLYRVDGVDPEEKTAFYYI